MVTVNEAVTAITDVLNNVLYLEDPYPARVGRHFYTFLEGLNLDRRETFPKGYIEKGRLVTQRDNAIGKNINWMEICTINVYYYVVANEYGNKYVVGANAYEEEGLVEYMMDRIRQALNDNQDQFPDLHQLEFGNMDTPRRFKSPNGKFTLCGGIIPVTVRWHGC